MDLTEVYQVAGGRTNEDLQAFVDRQRLTAPQLQKVVNELMEVGHSPSLCSALGMDYQRAEYTPLARAYACVQAGCR